MVILLINKIRYNYTTQVKREIMVNVFVAQFINTGILLLLTTANFQGTVLAFIPIRNNYSDFTSEWYIVTGKSLVMAMIVNAFMPYVFLLFALVKFWLLGLIDRCKAKKGEKTSIKTV